MAIALVTNTIKGGNSTGVTSDAIDTTGATLLVVRVASAQGATQSVSDSKSNTWTPLTKYRSSTSDFYNASEQLFYVQNPTVGSGHTFTVSGTETYPSIAVQAFSGTAVASVYDGVENGGGTTSATAFATGSITPSQNNCVVVTGINIRNSGASGWAITETMTITNSIDSVNGASYGGSMAYKVQATATAINPSWSWTPSNEAAASIAAFRAAGGVAGPLIGGRLVNGGLLRGRLVRAA